MVAAWAISVSIDIDNLIPDKIDNAIEYVGDKLDDAKIDGHRLKKVGIDGHRMKKFGKKLGKFF